ncbi:MAG: hypothetical protein NZ551_08955 [Microscillaceae bacterium]|nr:hypothetical protein [Microscillaceae bacterium]MDW8461328.1 hypothetical protein [Cytophagales bacterium]
MKASKENIISKAQARHRWAWYVWLVSFLTMQSGFFLPQNAIFEDKETLAVAKNTLNQPTTKQAKKSASEETEDTEKSTFPELKPAYVVPTSSVSVLFCAVNFNFLYAIVPQVAAYTPSIRKVAIALLPFFQKTFCHHIAINAP